ncbi:hypothetical protein PFISCL1PPCAC_3449, partial [Pristionchus fissidentatus]
ETLITCFERILLQTDIGKSISRSTVRKVLSAMGFTWRKLVTRCHMYLNPAISSLRNAYLTIMDNLRKGTGADTPYFAYLDETWLYPGMKHEYGCVDNLADGDPFLAMKMGHYPGMEAEFKKGERLVLIGLFSEDGFIHYKVYRTGKKEDESTRDYHGEMNAEVFEAYVEHALAELAKWAKAKNRKPILVMDNASYHSRFLSKIACTFKSKREYKEFLEKNSIPYDPKLKKAELYSEVPEIVVAKLDKSTYNVWAVEQIAKKHGDDVEAHAQRVVERIFDSFPVSKAPSYIAHVRKKEEEHIHKGSLTFSHADLDPHAFVRAQLRADHDDLDAIPVPASTERGEEGGEEENDGE